MSILFFDIETLANPAALALLPEPKPAKNLKDPEKIAADIAAKKAEQIAQAALDPDTAQICSIGFATLEIPARAVMLHEMSEVAMLETFWSEMAACRGFCCGYNILSFDLPFIMRRSMALGVKPSGIPNLAKYRTSPITDLFGILYNFAPGKGLKTVAKLYGLDNSDSDVDGSQIAELWAAQEYDKIRSYQLRDVDLCIRLYQRMLGVYFV